MNCFLNFIIIIICYLIAGYFSKMKELVEAARIEIQSYADLARDAMNKVSRDMGSCNYNVDIKNKTYVELTGPSQGFIFDSSEVDQRSNCQSFNGQYDHCKPNDPSCFSQSCSADGGVLKNCEVISTKSMAICPSVSHLNIYFNFHVEIKLFILFFS